MKKVSVMVAAILGLALSVGANAQVSKKDQEFLNKAAVGGLYEVEAGRLAQEKANSSDVKAFGEMLVKDHSSANDELKALATSKSAVLPSELPAEKKNRLAKVAEAKHFDKEFIREVGDRKSTRLNSSHTVISYAVFCLDKKHGSPRQTTRNRRL